MSRRTRLYNGFVSAVAGDHTAATASIQLTDATGLAAPGRVVLDYDKAELREWIQFEGITGTTLTGVTRGLAGSSGAGGPVAHADGALVRSVPMHQHFDDIFSDIEDLEAAGISHSASPNPHPVYALDGDVAAVQAELDATQVTLATTQADLNTAEAAIDVLEAAPIQTPTGAIVMWYNAGGGGVPVGWLLCDGSPIPAEFTALQAIVGGPNTPNLTGRFPYGATPIIEVGETGGAFDHTHTTASHDHGIPTASTHNHDPLSGAQSSVPSATGNRMYVHNASTGERHTHDVPGSGSHDHGGTTNMRSAGATGGANPPYIGVNFIIKT